MSEFQPLIDQLYRERVLRWKQTTPSQRLDMALEMADTFYGVGSDTPEMRRRLEIARRLREHKCYGPLQPRR